MAEGSRIHRMIQRRMGSEYHAEVPLRYRREYETYSLLLEGRADGVIDQKMLRSLRYTVDDLMSALRTQSIFDISQVQYAVVETTGAVSFSPAAGKNRQSG